MSDTAAGSSFVGRAFADSPVRTVFLGSGRFAVAILDTLVSMPGIRVEAVVSAPDRPVGRKAVLTPTPVTARARELGLTVLQPVRVRRPEAVEELRALAPDLMVLADYAQLIPRALLDLPPRGFLNLHPSALPRHRGATPITATILAGDTESAVTLIVVAEEMDTGPIVATEPLEVRPDDTAVTLGERAALAAGELLRRALPEWLAGRLVARPQPAEGVTLTRPLRREDGRLNLLADAAVELERQVRAYQPWPGSYVETPAGRLIVWRATACPGAPGDEPEMIVAHGDGLAVCTVGDRLVLDEVQLAGKRRVSGAELRRGYRGLVGKFVA
ncbi:MAG: methionyl-tRNA formyltransferase [Candidatus Limnocylindrales bacterium]